MMIAPKNLLLALAVIVSLAGALAAQTPEQQFAFATELSDNNEGTFAILEFRRFVHLFPGHAKAPDAQMAIAGLYLGFVGDIEAASSELALVKENYPNSAAAIQANTLLQFLQANSDFDGEPLLLFVGARSARKRSEHEAALAKLDTLLARFPRANIADEAVLLKAQILHKDLKRYDQAVALYDQLGVLHPGSPHILTAKLEAAQAVAEQGHRQPAIARYRQIIAANPNTPAAATARERIEALKDSRGDMKREFPEENVKPFTVIKKGYLSPRGRRVYTVLIKVDPALTAEQVQATLEDALAKHRDEREKKPDRVRVQAFRNYPVTEAGQVTWIPEGDVRRYEIKDRDAEDVGKDLIWDFLNR